MAHLSSQTRGRRRPWGPHSNLALATGEASEIQVVFQSSLFPALSSISTSASVAAVLLTSDKVKTFILRKNFTCRICPCYRCDSITSSFYNVTSESRLFGGSEPRRELSLSAERFSVRTGVRTSRIMSPFFCVNTALLRAFYYAIHCLYLQYILDVLLQCR